MLYYPGDEEELDLHGYRVKEALELFLDAYNQRARSNSGDRLVVVHGYGSSGEGGSIRRQLRKLLDQHPEELDYVKGESLGNPGITVVTPHSPLLTPGDRLEQQIFSFCIKPRTAEKIAGKFRRHGQPQVLEVLRKMERQGILRIVMCGRYKCYEAVSGGKLEQS